MAEPLIIDSVTVLGDSARGRVVVTGSHGGLYAAICAAKAGIRAAIFNDAGVGKDDAGIAGLQLLQELGIPASTVDAATAQIGRAESTWNDGVVVHMNALARDLGLKPGMRSPEATAILAKAEMVSAKDIPATEARIRIADGPPVIWALDSASLVKPEDKDAILFIGSHGGLLGGRPETALKFDARAAVYHDASIGYRQAGISRLPALDVRGIPAATVGASSARIGDGRSIYEDGVISTVNDTAKRFGARIGMTSREFAAAIANAISV